jgi:DNA-binding IclR family transcriptional regulator
MNSRKNAQSTPARRQTTPRVLSRPPHGADRSGIQVIARAAAILRALKENPDGLSLGELAAYLNLPRSTIQRIIGALDSENLVIAASPARGVRLGPAILALAQATNFRLADIARPVLSEISRESGETVDLSQLDGSKLVFLEQVHGVQRLRAESGIGVSFDLHSSAPGKAMLAMMSDEELGKVRSRIELIRHTPSTIRSWRALEAALQDVRSSGVATDLEENSPGICALAMGMRFSSGVLAAVSIPVPAQRFTQIRPSLEGLLRAGCAKLGQRLGSTLV